MPKRCCAWPEGRTPFYVIEEKRGFIEQQVIQILHEARQAGSAGRRRPTVWGKKFPHDLAGIPEERGFNASLLMERLLPLFLHGGFR